MVDYHPLISRAVSGLDNNTGENRRALYERARSALVNQLRSVWPTLDESDITRERLALEEAIRNIEAKAAREFRPEPVPVPDPLGELAKLIGESDPFSSELLVPPSQELQDQLQQAAVAALRDRQQDEETKRQQVENRRPHVVRAKLAEVASPAPSLTPDGRLDAGPNPIYDVPTVDNDLPALPIRQRALLKTIIAGLPRNAPKQLKKSLESYDDELKVRGVQPILGMLKDMAAIIEADVGASDAGREWLEDGMRKAFQLFAENHARFVKYFPLDPEREELYQDTFVDESKASGPALSKPFADVAEATLGANRLGATTDDFLRIVDKLAEFAKVISTQPPSPLSPAVSSGRRDPNGTAIDNFVVGSKDRINPDDLSITPKKRVLLSGIGFFERVYNLLGSSVTLASTASGNALLTTLRSAIIALSKLIGF